MSLRLIKPSQVLESEVGWLKGIAGISKLTNAHEIIDICSSIMKGLILYPHNNLIENTVITLSNNKIASFCFSFPQPWKN